MQFRRQGGGFSVQFKSPRREDFGLLGMVVRFAINVAALWLAQFLVRGFNIDSPAALIVGALVFGVMNAVVKPVVSFISCPLTCLTLGLFMLVINAIMLRLTGWVAGWFDLAFVVDGWWAAILGALVIAVTSAVISTWADTAILGKNDYDR